MRIYLGDDEYVTPEELMRGLSAGTMHDPGGVLFDLLVHWAKETGQQIPREYGDLRGEVAAALRNTTSCPGWARSNP